MTRRPRHIDHLDAITRSLLKQHDRARTTELGLCPRPDTTPRSRSLIPIDPNTPARCHATVLALPAIRWLFAIDRHKKMIMDSVDANMIMKPAPGFFDHDQLSEETFALRKSLSIHDAEFGEGS